MAVRYAVASGNWSNTATWNGGTLPTSADDVYSNNFTVTIDQNTNVLTLRNTAQSPAVSGGGFILNSGVTVTCTSAANGIVSNGTNVVITYSAASGTSVINSIIVAIFGSAGNGSSILHSGSATLTVNGNISGVGAGSNQGNNAIRVTSNGILNVNGNINLPSPLGPTIFITSNATVNVVGDVATHGHINCYTIQISGVNSVLNITGNLIVQVSTNPTFATVALLLVASCTVNITGNIYGEGATSTTNNHNAILSSVACSINITGTIFSSTSGTNIGCNAINLSGTSYLNHIGTIIGNKSQVAVLSSNLSAINIFTGPFVCSETGIMPIYVARMHYRKTLGSYFEFRDSSTNGALPPASPAPATRLVSPDTIVDAPVPANVRNGVSYALGTFTGTLKVPSPDSVAKGVQTDNTVGTAALTPEAVWNALTSAMTTPGSIGNRLKNTSTVETTGDQIAALL